MLIEQFMKESLSEKANRLPMLPGVYIMLDQTGKVIYVGKAKKLKNRVSSYFHGEHLPKVAAMIEKIDDFNIIVVSSEMEALVLENSLIKQHKPHYNILLKDDKGYPFIRIDLNSEYPNLSLSAKVKKDSAKYFGPFGARRKTHELISALKKAYKLPDCSLSLPRDIGKYRPCLNYDIGNCRGWCMESRPEEYKDRIGQIERILQGHSEELIADLKSEMLQASDDLDFERAAELRDRLKLLDSFQNKQSVFSTSIESSDVIGFHRGPVCCFAVIRYQNGNLVDKDFEIVTDPLEDDSEAVCELVKQYYNRPGIEVPSTLLLPYELEFSDGLADFLSNISGHKVQIEVPKRGLKHNLILTASQNAEEEIIRITSENQRRRKTVDLLRKTLSLESYPRRIEAFDISNLGNTGIVSGMTVFIDGVKSKKDYRKFRLSDMVQQNDYESMYRTVYRRFQSAINGKTGFTEFPDLLLIDGGSEHAAAALRALQELGLSMPVFGMVKDDRHRTRALIDAEGEEFSIRGNQALFSFIGGIQEETHRFTIEYQKQLRNNSINSILSEIPGIGPKRRDILIQHYKSAAAVSNASIEELETMLPRDAAISVYQYFHGTETL